MLDHEIGGAIVRRPFTRHGVYLRGGDRLSGDEVRAIPIANRSALIDSHFLEVFPTSGYLPPSDGPNGELYMVHRGAGMYDVIEGRRLNDEPLEKEAAEALIDERE